MTDRQRLNLYRKEFLVKFCYRGIQRRPKFLLGDKVRIRKDASSIFGRYFDELFNDYKVGLIAGFDDCRKEAKKRRREGIVVRVVYVGMKIASASTARFTDNERELKDFDDICFDYTVKFPDGRCITFVGTWLRKA